MTGQETHVELQWKVNSIEKVSKISFPLCYCSSAAGQRLEIIQSCQSVQYQKQRYREKGEREWGEIEIVFQITIGFLARIDQREISTLDLM